MGFTLRESDDIRLVTSQDGKTYRMRKSAYGFGEGITFYDDNGNEIESFLPEPDYSGTECIDVDTQNETTTVNGMTIRAVFAFKEWFE